MFIRRCTLKMIFFDIISFFSLLNYVNKIMEVFREVENYSLWAL